MEKPTIRFKGYTEDWEQRKLGDSCKINGRIGFRGYTEKDIVTKEAGGVLTFSPTNIVDNKLTMECKNTYITREKYDESPEIKISNGDILFVKTGSTLGKSALVTGLKEDASINPQIVVMRVEKNTETFMSNILITNGVMKQVAAVKIGGAVPTMTETELKNFTYFAPAEKEEKKKIGDFFRTLDHLITLHQRKCEETKILKKYMLQKMFPQNGQKVPEIRFKGFTEDWEQRKLGDNIVEYTEKTTENNQYPVLTSSRKGIFFQTDYYDGNQIASADNTGYNIVPYGYFTYRHMSDDEIFHFNINDIAENGIVSTLYPVFTTDENLDSRYLQYQLNYGREFSRYAILQKQGGSRTYMYLNKLRNLYLTVPTAIEEQKKISEYFTNLDHLITLHQRKYEELKNIKKFMLQNMFV